jgi:hypothetical protein
MTGYDAADLLAEVGDLVSDRVARLAPADPYRAVFVEFIHGLNRRIGRPPVAPVDTPLDNVRVLPGRPDGREGTNR